MTIPAKNNPATRTPGYQREQRRAFGSLTYHLKSVYAFLENGTQFVQEPE